VPPYPDPSTHQTGSVRFGKEAPLGAATPPRDAGGAGPGPGAAEPVMWGGAGSAAARQMLAGLGLAGLGLSRTGAWGPGFDISRLARAAAEARCPRRAHMRRCRCEELQCLSPCIRTSIVSMCGFALL